MSTASPHPPAALPELIRPMLATLGELPPADEDARWGYEMKWDGVRAVAYLDGRGLRLVSRNDLDVTISYPELVPLAAGLGGEQAVLDGEIVSFDATGRPSFGRLQERMHVQDRQTAARLAGSAPVTYLVFDVLHLAGRSTIGLPYRQRREVLEGLVLDGPSWRVPPSFTGGGADVLAASGEQRLEGVLAKRLDSVYRPGRRSPDWVKVKHVRTQEVVIVGWRPGNGRRAGRIGSLILGVPAGGGLRWAGGVGTGFTERALDELGRRLSPYTRADPPLSGPLSAAEFRDAHWVEPVLVGEVAFGEWTSDGRMRHPSWRGLRPDKSPADVRIET